MADASRQSHRRVAYIASSALLKAADPLPSNEGRSTLVHSLAYQLGLLSVDDEHGEPSLSELLGGPSSSHSLASAARATVIAPRRATAAQLRSYHTAPFVDELLRVRDADEPTSDFEEADLSERPAKRAKRADKDVTEANDTFGLTDDNPTFPELADHVCLIAGASITAAEQLAEGKADVAVVWDGGRHHAKKGLASGFCYVNDAVLAILALRKPRKRMHHEIDATLSTIAEPHFGFGSRPEQIRSSIDVPPQPPPTPLKLSRPERILYLDIDLHWGDGVEDAFFNTGSVMTLSVHMFAPGFFPCGLSNRGSSSVTARYSPSEQDEHSGDQPSLDSQKKSSNGPPGSLYGPTGPAAKEGKPNLASLSALSVPLRPGASGATLLRILETCIQPLALAYDPEYVVLQCGADALSADPTATFNYDLHSFVTVVQRVLDWNRPTLLLGGGGYDDANAARCWGAVLACTLGRWTNEAAQDDGINAETPIPDHATWPAYAPSYTLDVPAGQMTDTNTAEYLAELETVCKRRASIIHSLVHT